MDNRPFNLQASVNEYAFARLMEDTNKVLLNAGKPVVMVSQCNAIHTALLKELADNGKSMSTAAESSFMAAFTKVMGQSFNINADFYEGDKNSYRKPRYKRYMDEYQYITGWTLDANGPGAEQRRTGTQPMDGYIPISPFAGFYQNRQTVLNHGTEILYAKQKDMVKFEQQADGNYKLVNVHDTDEQEKDVDLYQRKPSRNGEENYRKAGKAYVKEDGYTLSRLRPYMTESDYKSCVSWMDIPKEDMMSPNAQERAADILKLLTDEGIPFKVTRDKNPGQLKVDVSNTKLSIRLTDTLQNEQYIGRTYKDGVAMFLMPKYGTVDYSPSIEDIRVLVKYSLGQQPERINSGSQSVGPLVGNPSSYQYTREDKESKTQKRVTNCTTYISVKNDSAELRTAIGYTSDAFTDSRGKKGRVPVSIRTKNNHSASHLSFESQDDAVDFLKESIESARSRFVEMLNIDGLIQEAAEFADDETHVPTFSADAGIAPIQQTYWEVLTGKSELYRPTEKVDDETFSSLFEALGLLDAEEDVDDTIAVNHTDTINGQQMYVGTPEEKIRQHLTESLDVLFGSYEPDANGKRFNPALVASFMDSPNGIYRNNDNIVAAMYKLEFTGDELRGNDFQTGAMKDRLLRFDNESAIRMDSLESPFMQTMFNQVKTTLETTACRVNPEDILIDKNGVVHYTAYETIDNGAERKVEGMVGQIFEPDEDGLVETHYNGSENRLFSPGYNAYIKSPEGRVGNNNFMERVRLRGLAQVMAENIGTTIRTDLLNGDSEPLYNDDGEQIGVTIGSTTNINNTYRSLYTTGYKVNIERQPDETLKEAYLRQTALTGMPPEVQKAVFETASRAFRFGNEYRDNSTVDAETRYSYIMNLEDEPVHALTNDNVMDYYNMTGHTNLAITKAGSKGYSDDVQTGSGKNQGITRYLGVGVEVDGKTGEVIPVKDNQGNLVDTKSHLRQILADKFGADIIDATPADRIQMVTSNLQSASGIAGWDSHTNSKGQEVNGVGIGQFTIQGFTFDDGMPVSKEFAEANPVVMENGETRPLMPGDKICDFAGNKGVISIVVDRNMSLEDAEKQNIKPLVEVFKLNPDLDVVQAPYSAVSRFNATGAKLAMRTPMELKLPDGSVHEGCLGFAPIIITKHTANDHTRLYGDEDDVPSNNAKGRKVSAQMGWIFTANDSKELMKEFFSNNNAAVTDCREVLNVLGLDMDEVGKLRKEYEPHFGEERNVFHLPDDETIKNTQEKDLVNLFRDSVNSKGGFLEIPFPIKLSSGLETPEIPAEQASRLDRKMYQLPVLSAHLRSGQTFEDGSSRVHDYTNQYARIFTNSLKYMKAEADLAELHAAGDHSKDNVIEQQKNQAKYDLLSSYNVIADDLKNRKIETKHNMFRDEFEAKRVIHSATAVWTPDPRLPVDTIGINQKMADSLGVKEGDWILMDRDPLWRDYGLRAQKIHIDNSICGMSLNPLIAISFDGDYDGDSGGLFKISGAAALKEAVLQYSFTMNMLDFTKIRENGDYALIFNTGMDVASAEFADEQKAKEIRANGGEYKTLAERRMEIEHKVNEVYRSKMSLADRWKANEALINEFSEWSMDALCKSFGTEVVSYNSEQEHLASLAAMVDHGAKGSHSKLGHYTKYMGWNVEKSQDGHILPETVEVSDKPLVTEQDIIDTEKSTAIKSHGTGNAGAISQRIVLALRNITGADEKSASDEALKKSTLSDALFLTYLATQGILQAKHDPEQAKVLYSSVKGPIREVWRGHALEKKMLDDGSHIWTSKKQLDANGNYVPVQATKEEWVQSFMDLHTDKDGLDLGGSINIEHVRQVAEALYNPDTGRMYDVEDDKTIEKLAAPMDILAYKHNNAFETLCNMADKGVNLYDGERSSLFAPKVITFNKQKLAENQEKLERGEIDDIHDGMKPLVKTDVRADYEPSEKISIDKSVIEIQKEDSDIAAAKGYDTSVDIATDIPVEEPIADKSVEDSVEPTVNEPVASDDSVKTDTVESAVESGEVTQNTVSDNKTSGSEVTDKEVTTGDTEKTGMSFNFGASIPEPEKSEAKSVSATKETHVDRGLPDTSNVDMSGPSGTGPKGLGE